MEIENRTELEEWLEGNLSRCPLCSSTNIQTWVNNKGSTYKQCECGYKFDENNS